MGNVAHECIIDIRPIKSSSGISEEDLAKRLIDFGYHAPTMSWPVTGTIMIEPTESENLEEIDKFCNALIQIKKEINMVESSKFDKDDNPLKNAPHTYIELASNEWKHKLFERKLPFRMSMSKIINFGHQLQESTMFMVIEISYVLALPWMNIKMKLHNLF